MLLCNNAASVVPEEKILRLINYNEIQTISKCQNESQNYHFEGLYKQITVTFYSHLYLLSF